MVWLFLSAVLVVVVYLGLSVPVVSDARCVVGYEYAPYVPAVVGFSVQRGMSPRYGVKRLRTEYYGAVR